MSQESSCSSICQECFQCRAPRMNRLVDYFRNRNQETPRFLVNWTEWPLTVPVAFLFITFPRLQMIEFFRRRLWVVSVIVKRSTDQDHQLILVFLSSPKVWRPGYNGVRPLQQSCSGWIKIREAYDWDAIHLPIKPPPPRVGSNKRCKYGSALIWARDNKGIKIHGLTEQLHWVHWLGCRFWKSPSAMNSSPCW